ncbi:PilZ domain-containing protein, partial [Calditrichota bacterium]
ILQERRSLKRFKILGAKVKYKQEKGFQGSKEYSGEGLLVDLTQNGVRFETHHNLKPGAIVYLDLIIKDKPIIPLTGNILWVAPGNEKTPANAVVQFFAFGDGKDYNLIESKILLEELTKEFNS